MANDTYAEKAPELQTPITAEAEQAPNDMKVKLLGYYVSLKSLPSNISSFIAWVLRTIDKGWRRFKLEVSQLTFSQSCYFLAAFVLFGMVDEGYDEILESFDQAPGAFWVGFIASIGLLRELWSLLHRIWQKALGKGILLILYAGTANLALSISALKINQISGIEPAPFIFTLGFTTFTMLPFWIIVASMLLFAIALVVQTLWLMIGLLLRIVRIKIRLHWEDEGFAVLTIILRLMLTPLVIVFVATVASPYMQQANFFEFPQGVFSSADSEEEVLNNLENRPVVQLFGQSNESVQEIIDQVKEEQRRAIENQQALAEEAAKKEEASRLMNEVEDQRDLDRLIAALPYFDRLSAINVPFNFSVTNTGHVPAIIGDEPNAYTGQSRGTASQLEQEPIIGNASNANEEELVATEEDEAEINRGLDRLIASFIFHFETYPNSMCKKKPSQHSLVIDENSVLLVEKADNELGYAFSVEACVPVYQKD